MSEQLPSRMSVELSLADGEPVEVYDRAIGPNPADVFPADVLSRFDALPSVLRGFLTALARDRLDADTILVFADWLEEHGHTAEGQRVRLLRPQPGAVLVFTPGHDVTNPAERDDLDRAADEVARRAGYDWWVRLPGPGYDLRAIDPEQLRAAGWVRESEAAERVRQEREEIARIVEQRGGTNPLPWLEELTYRAADYLAASIRARGDFA
jgi:uncharacterized protein (TIGR02996 family)